MFVICTLSFNLLVSCNCSFGIAKAVVVEIFFFPRRPLDPVSPYASIIPYQGTLA